MRAITTPSPREAAKEYPMPRKKKNPEESITKAKPVEPVLKMDSNEDAEPMSRRLTSPAELKAIQAQRGSHVAGARNRLAAAASLDTHIKAASIQSAATVAPKAAPIPAPAVVVEDAPQKAPRKARKAQASEPPPPTKREPNGIPVYYRVFPWNPKDGYVRRDFTLVGFPKWRAGEWRQDVVSPAMLQFLQNKKQKPRDRHSRPLFQIFFSREEMIDIQLAEEKRRKGLDTIERIQAGAPESQDLGELKIFSSKSLGTTEAQALDTTLRSSDLGRVRKQ